MPRLRALLIVALVLPVLAACADAPSGSSERSRDNDAGLQPRNMNAYTRP
jgi:hypothetical protein